MYNNIQQEKALLVVIKTQDETWSKEELSSEFRSLVLSVGIEVQDLINVNLKTPSPQFYIGKGKVEEIVAIVEEKQVKTVIFNSDLRFTQQRNLEEALGVKTIDRTQLILDIFAKHAQTQEGILQVEFAQLEYLLPKLRGEGIVLSRQGAGIGTLGPGEKKLEVDKRRILKRIDHLKKDIEQVRQHRDVMRKKRQRQNISICSLVGYTNAGKTTLFNALTQSSQTTSSALFTTLSTVSRTMSTDIKLKTVLSDTVGFIYKLPHHLIEAFKATLEELQYADLLLHVIDAGNKDILKYKDSVESVLGELKLDSKPRIHIFNKIDKVTSERLDCLRNQYPDAVFISATQKQGLKELLDAIDESIFGDMVEVIVEVPFNRMDIANYLHKSCQVLKTTYQGKEAVFRLKIKKGKLAAIEKQGLKIQKI